MKSLVALLICSLPLASSAETAVRQLSVAVVQFESIDGDITGNLKNAGGSTALSLRVRS